MFKSILAVSVLAGVIAIMPKVVAGVVFVFVVLAIVFWFADAFFSNPACRFKF